MPYNGLGVFNRVYSWVQDAANGIFVDATRTDTDSDDIADGLTNCVTRDGQSPPTANLPMGSFKLTGLANGSANSDSINYGQVYTDTGTFAALKTFGAGYTVSGGTVTMTAASSVLVPTATLGDNSTKAASTAFVAGTAFSSALPAISTATTGKAVTNNGTVGSWGIAVPSTTIITATGSFSPSTQYPVWCRVTVVGGGASGATSASTSTNSGGSAGGAAIKILLLNPAVTYTATVGAGGAAVLTGSTSGNSGGTSSFAGSGITTISATGGTGGVSTSIPGAPGVGSNGDLNLTGGAGENVTSLGSSGGASYIGPGGLFATDATNYGSGSGGSTAGTTGQAGKAGVIIIEYLTFA